MNECPSTLTQILASSPLPLLISTTITCSLRSLNSLFPPSSVAWLPPFSYVLVFIPTATPKPTFFLSIPPLQRSYCLALCPLSSRPPPLKAYHTLSFFFLSSLSVSPSFSFSFFRPFFSFTVSIDQVHAPARSSEPIKAFGWRFFLFFSFFNLISFSSCFSSYLFMELVTVWNAARTKHNDT